jgi:hypothetical protein
MASGALPQLESLHLTAIGQPTTLPPSWGSGKDTLPSLQELNLHMAVSGPLPAQWARGFRNLKLLVVSRAPCSLGMKQAQLLFESNSSSTGGSGSSGIIHTRARALEQPRLPPEWAAGFPNLSTLNLACLGLAGPIPQAWQEGGFPSLTNL